MIFFRTPVTDFRPIDAGQGALAPDSLVAPIQKLERVSSYLKCSYRHFT